MPGWRIQGRPASSQSRQPGGRRVGNALEHQLSLRQYRGVWAAGGHQRQKHAKRRPGHRLALEQPVTGSRAGRGHQEGWAQEKTPQPGRRVGLITRWTGHLEEPGRMCQQTDRQQQVDRHTLRAVGVQRLGLRPEHVPSHQGQTGAPVQSRLREALQRTLQGRQHQRAPSKTGGHLRVVSEHRAQEVRGAGKLALPKVAGGRGSLTLGLRLLSLAQPIGEGAQQGRRRAECHQPAGGVRAFGQHTGPRGV
ncbi:hypothetical protein H696_01221 [Fonticula alba]|uniref:Uncharacterized protein n=1 Tax=Fonticula alba TaxID=691883 RepID=A0A058ZCZ5_FONAL|nr:hypothetical protein H696_01221 [Fonticula alba]KCV71803.1 hypothetical protein H696_01221 [Fonticula alba]|eukprot:XP_009493381.1 hypothetical protein H696_01221 [Fonticula alba]